MQQVSADLYAGLNDAQRQAVMHGGRDLETCDTRTGPLIVLAGPGTGKTRVIVHRVARILQDGAEPESVLAVTFTNKAAAQLRERLAGLVGSARARRVRATTFHALGLSLVRRFAPDLGLPAIRADAAILDSAQRVRLVREAINAQGLFASRRAAGLDALCGIVQTGMRALANRAIEPGACSAFIETWRDRIGSGHDSTGAPVDATELRAEAARLEEFQDLTLAYGWFAGECRRRGWLGYEDLIMLPIRLLREVPNAAAIVRAEFRHALVDEFQDVNAGQIELLRQLFPPHPAPAPGTDPRGPDLCIVGDDDQAIYGFRGADDRAFARFDQLWPGSRRVLLTENYRSQPPVIAACNRVIALADQRFAPDKRVARAASLASSPLPVGAGAECIELATDKEDGAAIATAILLDRAAAPPPCRPWGAYAVVCRSNADITRIVSDLELEGIPARGSFGDSLSADPGVQDVLAWITLLVNPRESWPVHRILSRPPLAAQPLAAMEYAKRFRADRHLLGDDDIAPSYLAWLTEAAAADEAIGPAVQRLSALHRRLLQVASSSSAPEAIEQTIVLTDAAHADLLPARQRALRISALLALVRLARVSHSRLDQPGDLREFWRYWQDLDDDDRSLRQVGNLEERTENDDGAGDEESSLSPAVTVISAHKAKGLEWDTVFVPRVTPSHGYGRSGRSEPCPLPPGLLGDDAAAAAARQPSEERRIFYVACTRAERRLVLLSKKNKGRSKSKHFFEEFTREPEGQRLVQVRDVADLRREAAGVLGIDEPGGSTDPGWGELGGDALDRARLSVRLAAAEALEFADRPDAGQCGVDAAAARLRSAAARLAIVSHIGRHRAAPEWISGDRALEQFAATLVSISKRDHTPVALTQHPPLKLSYTAIDAYTRCPACYWMRFIKGLPETERSVTVLGQVVHRALERFYKAVREAEGAGREAPTVQTLLRWGREEFVAAAKAGKEPDRKELDQSLAQLTLAYEKLHDPAAQVLEIEPRILWEYECAGADGGAATLHRFEARVDRIDQVTLEDGRAGFRLIDYKSGQSWKSLLTPEADNLQFGIYALALPHIIPGIDLQDVTAEYWLLSTGQRGAIPMSSLRLDKVQAKINKAVCGILAGEFDPASACEGDCRLLAPHPPGG